jgi:hypothetical protein
MSRAQRLEFIEPQLPTLVDQPPEGADWIHEIKHDGYARGGMGIAAILEGAESSDRAELYDSSANDRANLRSQFSNVGEPLSQNLGAGPLSVRS